MTPDDLVAHYGLEPIPREGGRFRQTWAGPARPDGRPEGTAIVALLTLPGPGGSVLVTGDLVGTIWAVGPALIAVLVVAWPRLPAPRAAVADGA